MEPADLYGKPADWRQGGHLCIGYKMRRGVLCNFTIAAFLAQTKRGDSKMTVCKRLAVMAAAFIGLSVFAAGCQSVSPGESAQQSVTEEEVPTSITPSLGSILNEAPPIVSSGYDIEVIAEWAQNTLWEGSIKPIAEFYKQKAADDTPSPDDDDSSVDDDSSFETDDADSDKEDELRLKLTMAYEEMEVYSQAIGEQKEQYPELYESWTELEDKVEMLYACLGDSEKSGSTLAGVISDLIDILDIETAVADFRTCAEKAVTSAEDTQTGGGTSGDGQTSIIPNGSQTSYTPFDLKVMYTQKTVSVKLDASASSSTIGTFASGIDVSVVGQTGDWYAVAYGGQVGFVSKDSLQAEAPVVGGTTAMTTQTALVTTPQPLTTTTSVTTTTTKKPTTTTVTTTTTKKPTATTVTTTTTKKPTTTTTKVTTTTKATTTTKVTTTVQSGFSEYCSQMLKLANSERAAVGVGALVETSDLHNLATTRAQELATLFSHTRPDGSKASKVVFSLGYTKAAEIIAGGQATVEAAIDAWMGSTAGHRESLLNSKYSYCGIGHYYANGSHYWVIVFAG